MEASISPECQFLLNWFVQVAIAIATTAAVIVALFGNQLRALLWPPKLNLTVKELGAKPVTTVFTRVDGVTETSLSWWCHLLVENLRPWSPAQDVRVQILRLESPDSSGQFRLDWAGEGIQLRWAHQGFKPTALAIGPADVVDLFSVQKASQLGGPMKFNLHPLFRSFDLRADWTEACKIAVVVQAKALVGESKPLRIEIAWDGKWSDEATDMKRHVTWSAQPISSA